jgi:microcin C transport system substrate-binding protein
VIPAYPPEGVSYMDWFMLTWWARNANGVAVK